ncbi:RICIN domain-containing protein [Umezawaea endophytica]|uniref:RICIN domain-containing protein n=1 Tax=Umezawaea endophytica TaxID=1654476 RepID=A0A9X3ADU7_9PSEU|nr:RICIN domain-containing protein [Umezawaea endophytica]MCS7475245.1 RICIN domain-containing protein [Umezawaea endophytica]
MTAARTHSRVLRLAVAASLLLATCAATAGTASAAAVTVRPDPSYQQQPFQGWGTSLVWFANATGGYPDAIRTRLADLLFGADGLNLNIARYNIGGGNAPDVPPYLRAGGAVPGWWKAPAGTTRTDTDWWRPGDPALFDRAADPRQRWWVDRIKSRVDRWEAFSNSPPWFQTVSGYVSGGFDANADQLRRDRIGDFASYLTQAVDELERAHGIRFGTLDPFNEPNTSYWRTTLGANGNPTGGRQEGAHLGPALQAEVVPAVAAALARAATDAVVSAPDETNPGTFATDWNGYPQAVRGQVGQLNVHTYGTARRTSARDIAKGAAKPLWMSEVDGSWGDGQSFTSMDPGLGIAERVIDDLRELEPVSWLLWQAIEDYDNMKPGGESPNGMNWGVVQIPFTCGPNDTLTTCPIRTNTKFHTLRNFTHHIRPGDRLVKVGTTSDVAAVRGTSDALKSVVHLNKTTEAQQVTLDLSAFATVTSGATVRPVTTDANGALVTGTAVPVRDRAATLTVPARSVTTFVVDGVSGVAQGTGLPGRDHRLTGVQSGKSLAPNGTGLVQRDTNTAAADQRWRFERRTDGFGNRTQFAITNVGTGQRLAATGSGVGLTTPTSDGPTARWVLSTTGDGTWTVVNAGTGTLLDVTGESRANGAPIGLYQPTSGDNQRWTAVAVS